MWKTLSRHPLGSVQTCRDTFQTHAIQLLVTHKTHNRLTVQFEICGAFLLVNKPCHQNWSPGTNIITKNGHQNKPLYQKWSSEKYFTKNQHLHEPCDQELTPGKNLVTKISFISEWAYLVLCDQKIEPRQQWFLTPLPQKNLEFIDCTPINSSQ